MHAKIQKRKITEQKKPKNQLHFLQFYNFCISLPYLFAYILKTQQIALTK